MLNPVDLATTDSQTWLEDLFTSEYNYFETGSVIEQIQGCTLAWLPGVESLAAGSVIHRLQERNIDTAPEAWLAIVENRLTALGFERVRIYQRCQAENLERTLRQYDYQPSVEVALVAKAYNSSLEKAVSIQLRAIESKQDWQARLALQKTLKQGPDGYQSPARLWVDMERLKSDLGYMEPYLVYKKGKVCGAVSIAPTGNILRLKNLLVAPEFRRQGIGREIALSLRTVAYQRSFAAVACFAIDSAPSLMMYQQAGFTPISQQIEWVKSLGAPQ